MARVTIKFPVWADKFDDQRYFDMLKAGTIPATRHLVKVLSVPTHKVAGNWGGSWSVNFTGAITVELQRSYVNACKRAKCAWAIGHAIEHELLEAKQAIILARKLYPNASPYIAADEASGNLGGMAHVRACKELDGLSEQKYATELDKEYAFIGWP